MPDPLWLLDYVPASFKGVPFFVLSHSRSGGKRGPDHEYPQRDTGSPEDLGRKMHRYNVQAFTIGDAYHDDAAALITALDSGTGELVHPRWGSLQALCRSWTENETKDEQGMARFTLAFVEDLGLTGLKIAISGGPATKVANVLLKAAAKAAFVETFTTSGQPGTVVSRALADLDNRLTAVRAAINSPLAGVLTDVNAALTLLDVIADNALTLIGAPSELADDLVELVEQLGNIGALTVLAQGRPASLTFDVTPPADPGEAQQAANADALVRIVQRAALGELAAVAVDAAFDTYDDAVALRDEIAALIFAEEGFVVTIDEYQALLDTRVELVTDLTDKAASLVKLREITITVTTSALELAWSLYEDAERAEEIIDRNKIVHGGFIPPGVYRVLAE